LLGITILNMFRLIMWALVLFLEMTSNKEIMNS
jgi:hypothetical protein